MVLISSNNIETSKYCNAYTQSTTVPVGILKYHLLDGINLEAYHNLFAIEV